MRGVQRKLEFIDGGFWLTFAHWWEDVQILGEMGNLESYILVIFMEINVWMKEYMDVDCMSGLMLMLMLMYELNTFILVIIIIHIYTLDKIKFMGNYHQFFSLYQ